MLGLESNDLGLVLVAIIGALTTLLSGQKLREMRSAETPKQQHMEIAGALVSDKAARDWIKAAEKLVEALDRHSDCLGENTKACEDMGGDIRVVGARIGKLASEMEIARALAERGGK